MKQMPSPQCAVDLFRGLRSAACAAAFLAGVSGCSIGERSDNDSDVGTDTCNSNNDCASGNCDLEINACIAPEGALDGLILEIVPPSSVRGYGGLHFFKTVTGLRKSNDRFTLIAEAPTNVRGVLVAKVPPGVQSCDHPKEMVSEGTVAAELTFTPVEALVGLNVISYKVSSELVGAQYRFDLSLPIGAYDVYVEPVVTDQADPACPVVPQLSRGLRVSGERLDLTLNQALPQRLEVILPSQARFDGWQVDLVHPVTGELLSNQGVLALSQPADKPVQYETQIYYSLVAGTDYADTGQELLRLTPPPDIFGPVVFMHRAGLEVFTPGVAVIGNLPPFTGLVEYRTRVVREDEPGVAVSAMVSFAATSLTGVAEGVFASFDVSAETDQSGNVQVGLLPGSYRVRTVPALKFGLSASETQATVKLDLSKTLQLGEPVGMPRAASISGRVVALAGPSAVENTQVHALPSAVDSRCPVAAAGLDVEAQCQVSSYRVLQLALAEDPFTPRYATGLVDERGMFAIEEVDCNACKSGAGALFDVSLRPAPESRLPWVIKAGVNVADDVDLGELVLQSGVVQRGNLLTALPSSAQCVAKPESCVLPGALIRAYVVLDNERTVIEDPSGLPNCLTTGNLASGNQARCARSVLQVAESRARDDGGFELILPPGLN